MPFFIIMKNSVGKEVVKMVTSKGRLQYEAVDEAIKGEYLGDPIVYVYHASTAVMVNTAERVPYNGR